MDHGKKRNVPLKTAGLLSNRCTRRSFLKGVSIAAAAGSAGLMTGGCGSVASSEESKLKWQEFFKKNYRLMTQEEKDATVTRLERLAKLQRGLDIQMSTQEPRDNVLFGYAFNITRCKGYMDCVEACVQENNLDRQSKTQYIRLFELDPGQLDPTSGDGKYYHEVPVKDKFYMGVQCYHCENAPCIKACRTASWLWTTTGVSAAGTVWRPVLTGDADSTGVSRWCPKRRLTRNNIIWAIVCDGKGSWKNAHFAYREAARVKCPPASMHPPPVQESSAIFSTRTVKSVSYCRTRRFSGSRRSWGLIRNSGISWIDDACQYHKTNVLYDIIPRKT